MKNVLFTPFVFLLLFWTGFLIFVLPGKWGLKERALSYAGKLKSESDTGKISDFLIRIKAGIKRDKQMAELAESLAYIKNITILGSGRKVSAVMLFEELSDVFPGLARPFLDMAHSLALNNKEQAAEILYRETGDKYARDIGEFLASWEDIPQDELVSSLDAYRESLRMERNTKLKEKDELMSDLIYFPVVINCMTVLLNFVYVAFFIEQQEALTMLF